MPEFTKTASDGTEFSEESQEVVEFLEKYPDTPTETAVDLVKRKYENDFKLDNSYNN